MAGRTLNVERLEGRDCPSHVAFRPNRPVINGTQAADVIQGQAATCLPLSIFAGMARAGDVAARLHHLSTYRWSVDLYNPATGEPVTVRVRFTGWVTPDDPEVVRGEFWPVLMQRAFLKLKPSALRDGVGFDWAFPILEGRVADVDDSPRAYGMDAVRRDLAAGSLVAVANDAHCFLALRVRGTDLIVYNPWGVVQAIPLARFLRPDAYEVAVWRDD